jgi:ribosome maturation factor RimP
MGRGFAEPGIVHALEFASRRADALCGAEFRTPTGGPEGPQLYGAVGRRHGEVGLRNEQFTSLLSPMIEALGLECVAVEYVPQRGNSLVRIWIDASGRAVTLDDCESVSREAGALLDVNDPIPGRYTLEVSSPGVDRPLFTPAQFRRFVGQRVKLQTQLAVAGRRRFQGVIAAVEGERIAIEDAGERFEIEHGNVQKANLAPDYEALMGKGEKRGGKGRKAKQQ